MERVSLVRADKSRYSSDELGRLIESWKGDYLLLTTAAGAALAERSIERLIQVAEDTAAGIVYADLWDRQDGQVTDHPLIDYQPGSIRDSFDFGSFLFISRSAFDDTVQAHGALPGSLNWGALYDLRLRLSIDHPIIRIPEPLSTRDVDDQRTSGERAFDYVDPRRREYEIEMEKIATAHLRAIDAYLAPRFSAVPQSSAAFPVKASVVIPVRNRVKTIGDAMTSALSQVTDFDFNVIVVDNHSTDGTTDLMAGFAKDKPSVIHSVPVRRDLGIGGCWDEALFSPECGRYLVQLDSDDLYAGTDTLSRIVNAFDEGAYAMVIGSYTTVDFELRELPPGLVDHREWTRDNGRNNALRINGLGAPRAFDVEVLRKLGFPNVSYGEDYAVALRISREYEIGRILDSIYLARRWAGNSDSALPLATMNRYDSYKDRLRTYEILARQRINARVRSGA
jgi:hypothetical protein